VPQRATQATTASPIVSIHENKWCKRRSESQGLSGFKGPIVGFLNAWIFKPEYLPAWLQAVAAVVALGLGVWSVRASGAAQRRRDFLELRGLAVAIYPELCMLPALVQNVRERLANLRTRDGDQSFPASVELSAPIQMTPMLERNIDKLFLLGEIAGPSCLHLVRLIMQYNSAVQNIARATLIMNAAQRQEALGHIADHLSLIEQVIAKCEHEVRPIHDSVKE
jgi:predicted component of type VI protein secretion system